MIFTCKYSLFMSVTHNGGLHNDAFLGRFGAAFFDRVSLIFRMLVYGCNEV
jgi:hypothetical protein